jgi:uncharacterized membrane protein
MLRFLGPYHPQITHLPIVFIIASLAFELAGLLLDRDWLRKAALVMLVLGVAGAWLAIRSGHAAEHVANRQGVSHEAIDEHEEMANLAWWFGLAALAARLLAGRLGPARAAVTGIGLICHLVAAIAVGTAAHRGGLLVFEHGANVKLHGQLLQEGPPRVRGGARGGERGEGDAGATRR